ncbi:hypothetical protein HELRODRAFT_166933 [Helobdella robusta]|uniref:Uncharacterized protein n=1 Tax=Helobdella robusta TaxID=6412 RepID=T1EYR8_HELRO|nr:hypothetical protein HELRODRAFT_166933 [Helobdella robusta]ESO11858.1 hypothetical protein HELRODRAFT_166933 [Helobdella robusta]
MYSGKRQNCNLDQDMQHSQRLLRQKKMGKLPNILYPVAIKRKECPAKRKQLFQQRKLTFEKLRPSVQDQFRLSWVLSEETAKNCVQTDCIASINDVKEIIDPKYKMTVLICPVHLETKFFQ